MMIFLYYASVLFVSILVCGFTVGSRQMFHPPFIWMTLLYLVVSFTAAVLASQLASTKKKLKEAYKGWSVANAFASRFGKSSTFQMEVDSKLHSYAWEWNDIKARIVEINRLGRTGAHQKGLSLDTEIPSLERTATSRENEFYYLYDLAASATSQEDGHKIDLEPRNISYYVVRPERKTA